MKNATKGKILKAVALGVDVLPMFGATLSQFPVWVEKSSAATVSGLFLAFAILSAIPLFRQIKQWIKSPSIPVLLSVLAVLAICLRNIIDQMVMILVIGACANWGGSFIYKAGDAIEKKPDKPAEQETPQGDSEV